MSIINSGLFESSLSLKDGDFYNCTITVDGDGTITETGEFYTIVTSVNSNGDIVEKFTQGSVTKTRTTSIDENGNITVVCS